MILTAGFMKILLACKFSKLHLESIALNGNSNFCM